MERSDWTISERPYFEEGKGGTRCDDGMEQVGAKKDNVDRSDWSLGQKGGAGRGWPFRGIY